MAHPPEIISIDLIVNGVERKLEVAPLTTLLDLLRERLDLTGTKKGCDQGQCGACTILIDGRRINSCLTFAAMYDGAQITTIEGLAVNGAMHPLQQAFIDHDAFQCGYCTPGQICSAAGLIAEGRAKSADEIRELMSGNICRCGAYTNIVAAIQQVMTAPGSGRGAYNTTFTSTVLDNSLLDLARGTTTPQALATKLQQQWSSGRYPVQ